MPLGQFLASAQRRAPHASVVEHMAKASLARFASFSQQRPAARAPRGSAGIAQRRAVLCAGFLRLPSIGLRIGDHRAHSILMKLRDLPDGKVAFVPAEFTAQLLDGFFRQCLAERASKK